MGANGYLGIMSTRKNEHQGKWAFGANGHVKANGYCIWDKWALRACGDCDKWTFGVMGTLGQMGTLGPMSIGASGRWGHIGHLGKMGIRENKHWD